jgi:uncharacterized protein
MKNFIKIMKSRGHSFMITARDKDVTFQLMQSENIEYVSRGSGAHNLIGRIIYSINFLITNLKSIRRYQPNICVGIGSPYLVLVAFLIKRPSIIFEDTETAKQVLLIYKIFAKHIFTPSCFYKYLGLKQTYLEGYKELAYLSKSYFTPDPNVFQDLGIDSSKRYMLFRFVSHNVNHDKSSDGLSIEMKRKLISNFSDSYIVFISSEKGINLIFPKAELKIKAHKIHDVIAFSSLVVGESATMAAEAAILGIPSILFDNYGRGFTHELENKYNQIRRFDTSMASVEKACSLIVDILNNPDQSQFKYTQNRIFEDKIDITSFFIWFIEDYPDSAKVMKENPDYQYKYKF